MKVLIIQENGRNKENRHMRECHSLQYWMSMAGIEATCWGKGHPNFNIPFDQIRKNFDIIFCLENYNNSSNKEMLYVTLSRAKSTIIIVGTFEGSNELIH